MEDDYLLDDDDEALDETGYITPEGDDDSDDSDESEILVDSGTKPKVDKSIYGNRMTASELWLCSAYDDIILAGKNNKEGAIEDAAYIVVNANPKHTSAYTIGLVIKDLFHKQGHNRMVNRLYTPDTPLRGEDIDIDLNGEDDSGFNRKFTEESRDQVARFIGYLAGRDLSKDSVVSKRRKQRHIPAFIIFLFSSGMYDLILNCPTMPKEYQEQIDRALEKIMESKYDIVEELAQKYEEAGRQKVADRVRKLQLSWFNREPAEIRYTTEYEDLDLTQADVVIYREYRSKFTNTSRAITQDVISDLIEVVVDGDAGIYEKLKDKTRSEAISDVKQVYKDWAKENPLDSDLAKKVIWKETEAL